MKVILLQELKGKGGEGDIVDVAPGFANNYLFPQKMAVEATKGNLKQLEQRRHNIASREEARLGNAATTQEKLEGLLIKIDAKVGEEGRLFGSVTTQMIADAVEKAIGLEIDRKKIDLKEPIKTAGEHEILISLYRDIRSVVRISVGEEEEVEEKKEDSSTTETSDADKEEAVEEVVDSEHAEAVEQDEKPEAAEEA